MLGLLKMCYTCLGTNKKELIDVSKVDFDSVTYLYKLRACVSPELKENHSKQICEVCVKQLQISYRFREMVLLTQQTLHNHKHEILSGTYDSKTSYNMDVEQLFEPECIVKQDLASNNPRFRSLKTITENVQDDFPEITMDNNEDYFLLDLKGANASQVNAEFVTASSKPEKLYCDKCNAVLENNEDHFCDVLDSFNESDSKEENYKDSIEVKKKRGRPKKKMRAASPETVYECYHCSLKFNKRWKLQKHITRVHSDGKKYICTYCNKGFKQSYHLREHLTSHTGEKNYTCSFCDKSFPRISSMRRHIRSHEAAPGQKTKRTSFLCTVCGKSFPFSNGIQRHMRIHLGIRNHECNICKRKFTQSTHLHVHMRTHTGEKPYVCDLCGEAFSLNATLQKHMSIHQNKEAKEMRLKTA